MSLALFFVLFCLFCILGCGSAAADSQLLSSSPHFEIDLTPKVQTKNRLRVISLSDAIDGSATLVESSGSYVLVDGGEVGSGKVIREELRKLKVKSLALYLSHYHSDHYNGLLELLSDTTINITTLYIPNYQYLLSADSNLCPNAVEKRRLTKNIAAFRSLVRKAKNRGIKIVYLKKGRAFTFGSCKASVLSGCEYKSNVIDNSWGNNNSLVTRFDCGEGAVYLNCGDIGLTIQKKLLREGVNLKADIVNLPHHGYSINSYIDFLKAISPAYAYYNFDEESGRVLASETKYAVDNAMKVTNVLNTSYNGRLDFYSNNGVLSVKVGCGIRYTIRTRVIDGKKYGQYFYYNKFASTRYVFKSMIVKKLR